MSAGSTRFGILGPVEITVDGRPAVIGGTKPRTLLAVLLLAEGRSVSAQQLILELWGEQPPPTAPAALQVYVSGLRKVLGERLQWTGGGYQLELGDGELDAARFVAQIGAAKAQLAVRPADAAAAVASALALWRGEPMSGTGDAPAVRAGRARLEEQRMTAVEDRAGALLAVGQHEVVVEELVGLAARHPTRERLAAQLMIALYRCGRGNDAGQVYRDVVVAVRDEFDADPAEELTALAAAIARHDPTIGAPSALPIPATRFVGRRAELDRLETLLGTSRMLTLTGAGGSGKTRLALQLAREVGSALHPGGVTFVELAGSEDSGSVVARIASAFDVRELPGETLTDSIIARLHTTRVLLVLDNCEHLAAAVHALASLLLTRCSGIRILATSRESLGVPGEQLVHVGGLTVPGVEDSYATAMATDAVRLLAARGAAADTGFRIEIGNLAAAVAVCRRLDGLPLAIELAAARLRVLSLTEIEQRLDRQLDLLGSASPAAGERHGTIRATIDWSHDLLQKEERVLFRRLGVFVGGCAIEAAEQVGADPDSDPADTSRTVMDTLARLVDRSMIIPDHVAGKTRFRMLETVHQYALDRLAESGDGATARARHAAWYRALIETAPQFGGGDHAQWMRLIGTEIDNFRAAMEWALESTPAHEDALAIATPLWWYWWASGQMREGKQWLLRALDSADVGAGPLHAAALRAAAALARNSGDLAQARSLGERALAAQQKLGDPKGLAMAWNNLCMTATGQRDFAAALGYVQQSRAQAELIGDARGLAVAANNTGTVLRCMGRLDEAAAAFAEAVERFQAVGDVRGEAAAVGNVGVVARQLGDQVRARAMALESLRRYRDLDLAEGQLDAVEALACLDVAQGRPAAALRLLLLTERERRRLGAPIFVADESDARDAALASARASLGPKTIAELAAAADAEELTAVVEALLL